MQKLDSCLQIGLIGGVNRVLAPVGFVNSVATDFQGNPDPLPPASRPRLWTSANKEERFDRGASASDFLSALWVVDDGEGSTLPVAAEVLGRADAQLFEGDAVRGRSRLPLETIRKKVESVRRQRDGGLPIRRSGLPSSGTIPLQIPTRPNLRTLRPLSARTAERASAASSSPIPVASSTKRACHRAAARGHRSGSNSAISRASRSASTKLTLSSSRAAISARRKCLSRIARVKRPYAVPCDVIANAAGATAVILLGPSLLSERGRAWTKPFARPRTR